jgi:phospho-N-acetylmuramoyl-pentapeptide-transferase
MGGLMILSGLVVSTLLWANPLNPYVWIVLAVTLGFGFVGFYDDYLKVTKQTHKRLRRRSRCDRSGDRARRLLRAGAARAPPFSTSLAFPFFKDWCSTSAGSS